MPSFPITNLISLPSAIQIDSATFVNNLTVQGSLVVTGVIQMSAASVNRMVIVSNIVAAGASFTGALTLGTAVNATYSIVTPGGTRVRLGVSTSALSSDLSTIGDLGSNSITFVAAGTVLQVYFNQTGSVVLRGVVNLATF